MFSKNTYYPILALLIACQTIGISAFGQFGTLVFHELNQRNGLSELRNSYISQDSRGFVWIGGYDGLNKFDGKNVKVYHPYLLNGQPDPNISSKAFEDKDGMIWFTTYSSIHRLNPFTDDMTPIELPTISQDTVDDYYAFHLDKHDNLWLVANDTLRLFNLSSCTWTSLHQLETYVCQVFENSKGNVTGLAVPRPDGPSGLEIYRYGDADSFTKNTYFSETDEYGLPSLLITGVHLEGDTVLWLSSNIGLIRFPIKRPHGYKVFAPNKKGKITHVWDVANWGNLYLATGINDGLFLFDSQTEVVMNQTEAYVENRIVQLSNLHNALIDHEDNLWVSAWDKGVYFANLSHSKFLHLLKPTTLEFNKSRNVLGVVEGRQGQLWCITPNEGLVVLDENFNKIKVFGQVHPINDIASNGTFLNIQSDLYGGIWVQIGSDVYLSENVDGKFRHIGKNVDSFFQIIQIEIDRYFLLTMTGLYEISKKRQPIIDFGHTKPLKKFDRNYSMFWDKKNHLLISDGFDKISIFEIKDKGVVFIKDLINMGGINGVAISEKYNCLWLASNKGLIRLNKGSLKQRFIKDSKNLLSRSLNAILQDDSGNLWLSSNAGLFKYSPDSGEVKHYTESDGLQGLQFMPGSACKLADGRMAFGGVNGLNIFHPDSIRDNPTPPIVHFTDWVVNDTGSISSSPDYLPKQVFGYDKRTLTFHFIGIDYTAPDEVRYRFFLEGFDKDTVEAGTTDFARYAQLPDGDYTFNVWAANSDGTWTPNNEPRQLHFTILPPWWATWWARSLGLIAFFALIYAYYRFRINQIKKREEMLRMEAEFKQKEAEIKQQVSETETAILRLQMNPHFIFNSMNSISSYILKKDVATANSYLSRFAKLMRMILDQAAKPRITIAEEIELLELYVNTEAMRFEHKFTYEIQVDKSLDTDEVFIPTMLLQPFVENSIWHGISRKTGPGHIVIRFEENNGMLLCTVADNGAGRSAAPPQKNEGYESKALSITSRRLQLLENETKTKCLFRIIDLKDMNGNPTGTKAEVGIPLLVE